MLNSIISNFIGKKISVIKAVSLNEENAFIEDMTYESEINIRFSIFEPWLVIRPVFQNNNDKESPISLDVFVSRKPQNELARTGYGGKLKLKEISFKHLGRLLSYEFGTQLQFSNSIEMSENLKLNFDNGTLNISGQMPVPFCVVKTIKL